MKLHAPENVVGGDFMWCGRVTGRSAAAWDCQELENHYPRLGGGPLIARPTDREHVQAVRRGVLSSE